VMRDGRVAYDGPPVDAFTDADLSHDEGHHHPDLGQPGGDNAPAVAAPLEARRGEGR
jgi:zinc transport system ATP-binding protein